MRKITSRFPNLCILIVEDNFINQEVTKDILEYMGCKVALAKDGQEALQMAREFSYDLIFMDLQLPGMDGYEVVRHLREENVQKPIIVALTASALDGDKEKCFLAGMDDYISKPTEGAELEDILKKYFPTSRH